MLKVGIIFAEGCEEGETLTIVDILRRAELPCEIVGLNQIEVTGSHAITIRCDCLLTEDVADYDLVILPGGYGGAKEMCSNPLLQNILKQRNQEGKKIAAICAAPLALSEAGILSGRTFTCYPTVADKIQQGTFKNEIVVIDNNLITSQGPATAYAFAYTLVDVLGGDSGTVKKRMAYFDAFQDKEGQ